MIGVWPGKKDLGTIDGYNVYMTYNSIIFFFIPIFKFGKEYYAEKSGSTYRIDPEIGKRIEHGAEVSLTFTTADRVATPGSFGTGFDSSASHYNNPANEDGPRGTGKICMRCGYRTSDPEFTHCPKCGNLLVRE